VNQAVNAFKTPSAGLGDHVNLVTEKVHGRTGVRLDLPDDDGPDRRPTVWVADGSGRATSTSSSSTRRTARCTRSTAAIFDYFDAMLVG
jgi:hypothetical protein